MKHGKRIAVIAAITFGFAYAGTATSGNITCDGIAAPTKPMTFSGENFRAYCLPCVVALRTYGRVPVIDAVTAAFKAMNQSHPNIMLVYGEIGFPDGGRFRPHRTHRTGTSVDIMVPLEDGKTVTTSALNRFGYDAEFDDEGIGTDGSIDFDALAILIANLDQAAKHWGGSIKRVILAPDLQPELRQANPDVFRAVAFNTRQAWVRHDDHIHVDFEFACKK